MRIKREKAAPCRPPCSCGSAQQDLGLCIHRSWRMEQPAGTSGAEAGRGETCKDASVSYPRPQGTLKPRLNKRS